MNGIDVVPVEFQQLHQVSKRKDVVNTPVGDVSSFEFQAEVKLRRLLFRIGSLVNEFIATQDAVAV